MTCDEWENFGHTETSFGRREIVVDKTRDEWENSGHIMTSFNCKTVVYTTCVTSGKILFI